jgi:hypothetical protein
MKKHWKFAIKVLAFMLLAGVMISVINQILLPKKYYDTMWSTTSTYKGFYQIQKKSTDVLFLGSSHTASAFNPQVLNENYGISSYNLGCENQNVLVSYYWCKEALKYQSPKVVVLDTYMLFEYKSDEALNTDESSTRMAIDVMRWSSVKFNAIMDICNYDKKQSFYSYLFTNIRFHTRWASLSKQDFLYKQMENDFYLMGYEPLENKSNNTSYSPIVEYGTDDVKMVPLMKNYLDKIVDLCNDNNIKLILVKTPAMQWSPEEHNSVSKYAVERGICFYDFNDSQIYDESGFIFSEDMNDDGHSNIVGANKISMYISGFLKSDI